MPGLILGIDLCDDYCQISCFNRELMDAEQVSCSAEDENCLIPTVICKQKNMDQWHIGEEAYTHALCGQGTMVDKLVRMIGKDGKVTLEGITYTGAELLYRYLEQLLLIPKAKYKCDQIDRLVFCLEEESVAVMDILVNIGMQLGVPRGRVFVATHSEAYLYYVISQQKEIWANQTVLFNLTEQGLHYYELKTYRGRTPNVVEVTHQTLDERFSLDVLDTEQGQHIADHIMDACAKRLLGNMIVSTVFLTGRGFENPTWMQDSLQTICRKRRVFAGQGLFSKGAAFLAYDYGFEQSIYPYIGICEGRLPYTVSMNVMHEGRNRQLVIAAAGSNWYGARANAELIPDNQDELELTVSSIAGDKRILKVGLGDLPDRPNKMTRLEVVVTFSAGNAMTVRIYDRGFGDFYPASDVMIRKDFIL